MKKVLSLVLVIAMVLSSMSFAFASTSFEDIADTDYADAIEALTALGVVTGYEDGTFRPEKTVTRAEMAKLMVELLGYGDLVAGAKSNFVDTQGHWADAWIALAAGRGIVIGDGNGKFRPDATVSYNEVLTMLVRGLGYTDDCNELAGMTWPTNFKVKAAELDIIDDVEMNDGGADRGGVAQAMYNALQATLVTVTNEGDVTFLQDTVNGTSYDRLLITRVATPKYNYLITPERLDPNNKNYGGDIVDLAPYMFQELEVYLNDDKDVVYIEGSNSLVYEGTVDDVTTGSGFTTVAVEDANGKIKKVTFNTSASAISNDEVFENGSIRETSKLFTSLSDTETIKIVAMDSSENGKIEAGEVVGFVTTEQTKVGVVEQAYVEGKTKIDGFVLPENDDDEVDFENITIKGDAESLEDIEVNDVIVEYLSEDETVTTLVVTRNSVEGKITRVDGSSKFYVDGVLYELNTAPGHVTGLALGDEGVFFLDHDDLIVGYDGESAGPTNYAVVVGVAGGTTATRFGTSIDEYPQLKLATQDDETVVFDIQVKMDSAGVVSGSAKYTDSTTTAAIVPANNLTVSGIVVGDLIKYSTNSDGRISKVTVITGAGEDLTTTNSSVYASIDLDLAKNKLASNAIVFDSTSDDFEVVDVDALPSVVKAYTVRNSKGEIEVLVAMDGEITTGAQTVYAYINKLNAAYDENGDEVQLLVVYTDGVKKEIYTDATSLVSNGTKNAAYSFKYDGSLIDSSLLTTATASVATATSINAKGDMIELNVSAANQPGVTTGTEWYALSEHATIVGIDSRADGTPNSVNGIRDLYDITEGQSLKVFINTDGEIDLIVITEQ